MEVTWIKLILTALGSGFVLKILDIAYQEYRKRQKVSQSSQEILNLHVDPILKSADELVGKLRSLAQNDFVDFNKGLKVQNSLINNTELSNFCYLFAQFWARVQILRIEAIYVNISSDEMGKKLKSFLDALESNIVKLTERANQRAIGESLINHDKQNLSIFTYYEFVNFYRSDLNIKEWFQPLLKLLNSIDDKKQRQKLLIYGVILHALIDTLDSDHKVTKDRNGWANKLTKQNCRDLKYRTFKIYLPFVSNVDKYVSK